ncbi:5023_t:CDS:2, partial [Racocetra persica]
SGAIGGIIMVGGITSYLVVASKRSPIFKSPKCGRISPKITWQNTGDPQGVLIRAAEPLESHTIPTISQLQVNKDMKKIYYHTNGPGKLCRALNIDINLNHADLTTSDLIYLEHAPEIIPDQIVATKR